MSIPIKQSSPLLADSALRLPNGFPDLPIEVVERFPQVVQWHSGVRKFFSEWESGVRDFAAAVQETNELGGVLIADPQTGAIFIRPTRGMGSWADPITPFFVDRRGFFSLGGVLTLNPDEERLTVEGSIIADSGTIGGFDIEPDYIRDSADSFGLSSAVTGGDDVRFWAGDTFANRATAPFRVYESGALFASNATISGSIVVTSGTIGGFNIGADYIRDVGDTMGLASTVTGGDDVRFWAGDSFANRASAPFNVRESGILTATNNAVIVGTVSGRLTATLAAAINAAGNLITDVVNPRLDSASKFILSDFDFGSTNYAGAVKAGTITWNSVTGAITGGSGIVVYRGGIVGAAAGVATFTIDAATGAATFAGTLSAPTGNIGGWTIGSTTLVGGNATLDSVGQLILGTANDVFVASAADATYRLWVGNAAAGSAAFSVTKAGILTATGAVISGSISASSGMIGGFNIGADYIRDVGNTMGLASTVTGSDDVRFWAGDTFANRATAPYRVTESGALVASSAAIAGTISGRLTVTIASAIDSSGTLVTDLINARLNTSAKTMLSDFSFGAADYAGALKAGTITWNTSTGAITGGSGVLVYRGGIIGAASGVATFTIDASTGAATFAGALSAPTGNIGGWTIGANSLTGGNATLSSTGVLTLGTSNDVVVASAADATYRLWVGNATAGSAPFSVTKAGVLSATGATISGTITATTGTIGGFTIGATGLSAGSGVDRINIRSGGRAIDFGDTGTGPFMTLAAVSGAPSHVLINLNNTSATVVQIDTLGTSNSGRVRVGDNGGISAEILGDLPGRLLLYSATQDLRLDPDNGLVFESDTNLYRSAANVLRTDDSLIVMGTLDVGNASDTTISRVSSGVIAVEGATVYTQGGALGTPASGVVTNLTGTASININGTVGATTPTTGAFTTIAASGTLTLGGDANLYRGAADLLQTDDNFRVNGGFLRVGRGDSSFEGGQIELMRASDNAVGWHIDAYGNTGTPDLRFFDSGSNVRATLGAGGLDIPNDLTVSGTASLGTLKTGSYQIIGGESLAGYIEIQDSGGNTRKMAIVE